MTNEPRSCLIATVVQNSGAGSTSADTFLLYGEPLGGKNLEAGFPGGAIGRFTSGSSDLSWPAGAVGLGSLFDASAWFAPNWDTNGGVGVVEWSITAEPGGVPGTLEIGFFNWGNFSSTPDTITSYDLAPGAWSTGTLTIGNYDTSIPEDPVYQSAGVRWWPAWLLPFKP